MGWNPFDGYAGNSRELTPINAVLDKYLVDKAGDVRPDTLINYRSFVKVFKEWVEKNYGQIAISSFNKVMATNFMDYIVEVKGLHGRSYNNRLKQARAFFTYAIEKFYCKENPFATIKTKREEGKKRIMVPHEVRKEIGYNGFEGGDEHTIAYSDTAQNTLENNSENNTPSDEKSNEE